MDEEKRPALAMGSLFKTSESWYTLGANAILANGRQSESEMVQVACALGAALVTSVYIICRARAKAGNGDA